MKRILLALSLLLCICAAAQPRFTDSTFGNNGKVVENTSVPEVSIIDALLQPDGKTLTLAASRYNGINRTVLIRYNTNGTADGSFSGDGVADSLIFPGAECNPKAIRLQPDGRILVCGDTGKYYYNRAFAIRYNPNGSLDNSFGINGILYLPTVTVNGISFYLPTANNLLTLSGNKVMLLSTRSNPSSALVLVRLNNSGAIDSTFGSNGVALVNPPGASSGYDVSYTHIEVQTDGKFVVGGSFNTYGYFLTRITAVGALDNSYAANGSRLITGSNIGSGLTDMVIQPDNKVVVCGPQDSYAPHRYTAVFRLTATGSLDASFGNGGKQLIYASTTGFATLHPQLSLQTDGKTLVGGMAKNTTGNYDLAIARLTTGGLPDASFDSDGTAILQPNGYNSYGYVPLQQSDGKLILAGYVRSNDVQAVTISRFTSAGLPDATVNVVLSATLLSNGHADESGINLLVQSSSQKIISVRERSNGFNYDLCVSRHLPSGQPDVSFGTNGRTYLDLPGDYYEVYSGLSADGKITVVPDFADYVSFGALAVYRLKVDGQPDSSFGVNGKRIFKSRNADTVVNALFEAIVQPDGKIVMSIQQSEGYPNPNYSRDSTFIIRLKNDGSFDSSFNGNGKKHTPQGYRPIAVQPDGKIIISRNDTSGSGAGLTGFISRLNVDGSVDVTFNNGVERQLNEQITLGALQPDGKIVLSTASFSLLRLTGSGTTDSSFGTAGIIDLSAYYPTSPNYYIYLYNLRTDSGRIAVAGRAYDFNAGGNHYVTRVVALKNNGKVDSSFGTSGLVVSALSPEGNSDQIALQADKKIVLAGYIDAANNSGSVDFALTRLKANNLPTGRRYTFTGSGGWSNPANWADGTVPPTTLPAGSSVVIDPPTGSECVIDIVVHVQTGATVTVKAGKRVRLPGNLIIQ